MSSLLLRLPALRQMEAGITEELFFAGLIENVQIDSIIPHILKMDNKSNSNAWEPSSENSESNDVRSLNIIINLTQCFVFACTLQFIRNKFDNI